MMVGQFIKNSMKKEINTVTDVLENWTKLYNEEVFKEKKLKAEYKRKLKGLINISGLFKSLENDIHWTPIGFVEIELTDEKTNGYKAYQHARIINSDDKKLYLKTDCDDIRGVDHYYVWQTVGYLEDDFSGFLLFPLNNEKYFKVSYSC